MKDIHTSGSDFCTEEDVLPVGHLDTKREVSIRKVGILDPLHTTFYYYSGGVRAWAMGLGKFHCQGVQLIWIIVSPFESIFLQ